MRTFKIIAALITVATWATVASAGLILDVEVTGVSDAGTIVTSHYAKMHAGDTGTLTFYAKVTGTDTNYTNDGLSIAAGSFNSVVHDAKSLALVDITSGTVDSAFKTYTGWQGGSQAADGVLDSDGDKDWGSNNNTSATGWFEASASPMVMWTDAGTPAKFLLGTLTFMVEEGAIVGQFTDIQAIIRTGSNRYQWKEDTTAKNAYAGVSLDTPVTVEVIPEPATLALLALGGLGVLLGRKRRS